MQSQRASNILVLADGRGVSAANPPPNDENIGYVTLDDCAEGLERAVKALFAACGQIDAVVLANSFVGEPAAIEHGGSGARRCSREIPLVQC